MRTEGDRLAAIAQDRSIAGVIINGCIRDSAKINNLDTAIFALGTNLLNLKRTRTASWEAIFPLPVSNGSQTCGVTPMKMVFY
ncbi:hypothetical protein [Salsuginibacillus kocurii]|uniref:RraA family protein n=1 Tax=Salsuginibacillus kocurii TaxID=427078 RepID=UPI001F0B2F1A|nr:hypothetical protein [Salsuginibacillus kocurii]